MKHAHLSWPPAATAAAALAIAGLLASCSSAPKPHTTAAHIKPALACAAQITTRHISAGRVVRMHVHTVPGAAVTASGPVALTRREHPGAAANGAGDRALRLRLHGAAPGLSYVTVLVTLGDRRGSCSAALDVPAPPASPPATSCYPISDEGTCYEPGEFCRDDDHGMTGLAGDGETITCEDNDGWRWEPT